MKKSPYLPILTILILVFISWFKITISSDTTVSNVHDAIEAEETSEISSEEIPLQAQTKIQPERIEKPSAAKEPAEQSSASWRPAAVFGKKMAPVAQRQFPRGNHFSRRYQEPVQLEVSPTLSSEKPLVLAGSPEDGRFHLLAEEIDTHTLRAGRLAFDPAALNGVIEGRASRVLAPTLTEEVLTLEFKNIKTRSANTHTLQGHVVGEEETSTAQIVFHDGIIHGNVMRYRSGQELEYKVLADGYMTVRELDHATMTDQCATCSDEILSSIIEDESELDEGEYIIRSSGEVTSKDTTGWRTVDVVVGYGQEARIADGGYAQIEARIIDAVDQVTGAFANSGIADAELMLLGTIEDPDYLFSDTSGSDMGIEISALRTTNGSDGGALDTVTDFSNQLGADFSSFVIKEGRGSTAGVQSADKYTVISRTNMTPGRMTFAHEIGHCLGAGHAWGDSSNTVDSSRYAWRYTAPDDNQAYRTILSYNEGIGGITIPYYSNPNISFMGAPTGAPDGYDVSADPNEPADPIFFEQLVRIGGVFVPVRGFDGSNPDLGANNAGIIDNGNPADGKSGLAYNSSIATRTNFEVINPVAAARWERGTTQTIQFNGGDMQDLATIELYKNGVLDTTFATDVNAATHRNLEWTIPFDQAEGTDYMIRVTLDSNGSTLFADSGSFEIYSDLPNVKAQSAPAVPEVVGVVSQLELSFNVPMDPATFSVGSDIVSFTDPDGSSVISSITATTWSVSDTVLTIQFNPFSKSGTYQLVLGPDIEDTSGVKMDQDLDGTAGESVEDRYTANFTVNPPLIHYANMDTDPGWTFSANNPAYGWEWGQPTGGTGPSDGSSYPTQYGIEDPTSGYSGPNVIGYNLDGDYERGISSIRWATTPVLDCSNHQNVTLRFQRWLGVYSSDNASIEASNDGTNWTQIWANDGPKIDEKRWVEVEYDISAVADGRPTVYIRWGMGTTNSSLNDDSCGWNIDDVIVFGDALDGILLYSPNGGESYYTGSTVDLTWASILGGNVQIELLKNGSVDSTVTASTANNGSYSWQIPAGLTPGPDYKIRITSLDDPSKASESAADFTVISILVTSPNGGESYYAGTTANLTWVSSTGGNVQIVLLKNGSVDSTITANTVNDGSYDWQVPAGLTAGSDYRIRITSLEYPSGTAESAADFTIISILVTSPNGGERNYAGSTVNLTWVSSMGGNVKLDLLKNGSVDSTITASTANDNSYAWQIPASQTPGTDYRIRITSLEYPSKTAESAADFIIAAAPAVPYSESFATGTGDWIQDTSGDDFDWSRKTGSTPSGGTGPTTGQEGTGDYYLFTESSNSNSPSKLARISCFFNLTQTIQPELSFYYHMLGATMGTLVVEASTDDTNWDQLFSKTGDQGSAWIQASVSLSAYSGQYVRIRISGTTGSSFTSDMAVDSITLIETAVEQTFANWISSYSVGGLTAPNDDFDNDGIPNAVENYFGTDPGNFNAGLSATQVTTGSSTTFEFTHPINANPASDLTAAYRWSKDLSGFHGHGESDSGTTVSFSVGAPADGVVTVTATATGTPTEKLFIRVAVTQD